MWLVRVIDTVTRYCAMVASLIIIPLILSMVYEVLSRYVFSAPTFWAFEASYMMMGTIFLLGIGYALSQKQHVNVNFIVHLVPARILLTARLATYLVLVVLAAWLTAALFEYTISAYQSGEGSGVSSWNPTIWPYRVVYVLGFGLFALQIVAEIVRDAIALVRSTAHEAMQ